MTAEMQRRPRTSLESSTLTDRRPGNRESAARHPTGAAPHRHGPPPALLGDPYLELYVELL